MNHNLCILKLWLLAFINCFGIKINREQIKHAKKASASHDFKNRITGLIFIIIIKTSTQKNCARIILVRKTSRITWLICASVILPLHNYHRLLQIFPVNSGFSYDLTCIVAVDWFYMTVLFPKRMPIVGFIHSETLFSAIDGANLFK